DAHTPQRSAVAVEPVLVTREVESPRDEANAAVSERKEVCCRVTPTGPVSCRHRREAMRVAANRINKDNGSIEARDLGAGVFREIRDNEDNTVGATVGDTLHPSGRGEFTAAGCTDNEVDAG